VPADRGKPPHSVRVTGLHYIGDPAPTALTRVLALTAAAWDSMAFGNLDDAGYSVGLALHYFTDVTQAMHAANFQLFSSKPTDWHQEFEKRGMARTGTRARSPYRRPTSRPRSRRRRTSSCRPRLTPRKHPIDRRHHARPQRVGLVLVEVADALAGARRQSDPYRNEAPLRHENTVTQPRLAI
jgi:hypothetical protein